MVVYTNPKDVEWYKIPDWRLEFALLAHADPGEPHGKIIGLSRAFDLAKLHGAIPIDHRLSLELQVRKKHQFDAMMAKAGSNHTWLTSTLLFRMSKEGNSRGFGYIEESGGSMNQPVGSDAAAPGQSYLWIRPPSEYRGALFAVKFPHYELKRQGDAVHVLPDYTKATRVPTKELQLPKRAQLQVALSSLLPNLTSYESKDDGIHIPDQTLGFIAPAEGYRQFNKDSWNFWCVTTGGEAVIMKRPLR
jgi:hypothetical protein